MYFFTKFRRSVDFSRISAKIYGLLGVITVSGISVALGFAVVACVIAVACAPANQCVHDVASISAAAGVPLVPEVLTVVGCCCLSCC